MSRKPRNATRPPEDSPDTLPDRFVLYVGRIPGGWSVSFSIQGAPFVGSGRFGLLAAITGALKALARGGR
ncbi:hypothetical protein Mx9_p44 [Myxococcus phage Mx9]|nr:Orf7 [Myxococcus phage Mx9]WFG54151.1 hypothetical protein Mx9_p44 [Myxococcus phage Mx9]